MYDRILIPTDGSVSADRAGDHAIELAKRFDADVHVLFVADTRESIQYASGRSGADRDAVREEGKKVTTAVVDRTEKEGLEAVTAVRSGVPYQEILNYVDENEIDLVVIGAHGTTGIDTHMLLGSVAEKVIRAATVPIHVVKMTDVAVADIGEVTERARDVLRREGYEVASVVDTERSGPTWFVRVRTTDGDHVSVTVDVETGDTNVETP